MRAERGWAGRPSRRRGRAGAEEEDGEDEDEGSEDEDGVNEDGPGAWGGAVTRSGARAV